MWGDPWLPDDANLYISTTELTYLNSHTVESLVYSGTHVWDQSLLRDIFCSRDVQLILNLPVTEKGSLDCQFWIGDEKGTVYTVGSGYRLASGVS